MRTVLIMMLTLLMATMAFAQNWDEFAVSQTEDQEPYFSFPADLDGDGDIDILYASIPTGDFRWAENIDATAGEWADHLIYEDYYVTVSSIGAADLDGDGDMDPFISKNDSNYIQWFENTAGDGSAWTLNSLSLYTSDYTINQVIAVDLDQDGDMDLVAANDDEDYPVAGWLNEGNGSWSTDAMVNLDADGGAHDIAAGDIDQDGDIDFAGSSSTPSSYWWGNCVGTMYPDYTIAETSGAYAVDLADLDGDGDLDVIGAPRYDGNDMKVWLKGSNDWDEIVVTQAMFYENFRDVVAEDVDVDGDVDIISINLDGFVIYHENEDGDGTNWYSSSIGGYSEGRTVHMADIDGDGVKDVVFADPYNGVSWMKNPADAQLGDVIITDYFDGMSEDEGMIQWLFDIFSTGSDNPYLNVTVDLNIANPTVLTSVSGQLTSPDMPGMELWVDFALDGTLWTADITRPVGQHMFPLDIAKRLDKIYSDEYAHDDLVSLPYPDMPQCAPRVVLSQVEAVHPNDGTLTFATSVELPDYREQLNAHAEDNGRVGLSWDHIKRVNGSNIDSDSFDLIVGDHWDESDPNYTGFVDGQLVREIPWSAAVATDTEELVFTMQSSPFPKVHSTGTATIEVTSTRSEVGNHAAKLYSFAPLELTSTSTCSIHVYINSGYEALMHDADGDGVYEEEFEPIVTGVDEDGDAPVTQPTRHDLVRVYPNPFNPATTVSVTLERPGQMQVQVVDLLGRQVATLADGMHSTGRHEFVFDGRHLASGVYLLQVQATDLNVMRKLVLLK